MISKTVKCVGVTYTIQVPETPAEFDALAKREGACVDEAVSNVIYRGVNADFRDAFLSALCAKYNYTRPTTTEGEGEKARQVFTQSEKKDIDQIVADNNVDEATLQSIADEVMSGSEAPKFDPSQRERKTKEPSLGKEDLAQAKQIVADDSLLAKFTKNAKKRYDIEVVLTDDPEANVKIVAAAIKSARAKSLSTLTA